MVILLVIILTAFCLVVLALPFLQKGRERVPSGSNLRLDRQRLYGDLRLLDEERLLGHISEADYQKQAEDMRLRAAELVRQEQAEAQAADAARAAARAARGKGRPSGRPQAPEPSQRRGGPAPRP
ncbi:MAG: hypothetical protein HYY01_05320 [Chloroflexi bacterium]|nr:hypothetical protein [Chloroflexota bacterium]